MSKRRRPIIIQAPAASPTPSAAPPAASAPPAAPTPSSLDRALDTLIWLFGAAVFVIGLYTVVGWIDGARNPDLPPGVVCWDVTRATADGRERSHRCAAAPGWHVEDWPGVGQVAVPDRAPARRHYATE